MQPKDRLIVALDFADAELALDLADRVREHVGLFKVGLPLVMGAGLSAVDRLRREGHQIFLDLKFHDIPTTVAMAIRGGARHCARMMTVHALGGQDMLRAAVGAMSDMTIIPGEPLPHILAVTLLTHMNAEQQAQLGLGNDPTTRVMQLAQLARDAGVDGVIASAREAARIRETCGQDFLIVCPGIRPADSDKHEQARHSTATDAIRAGADYIVVGRPVRQAADPSAVAQALVEEISAAQA